MITLVFCGDMHRRWESFRQTVEKADLRDYAIIHLGDGGFGMRADRRTELDVMIKNNQWLADRNCVMYNIRGNHDNPHWFMPTTKFIDYLVKEDQNVPAWKKQDYYYMYLYVEPFKFAETVHGLSNVKFVQDYTVINVGDYNILCIGGATSIDRSIKRQQGLHYANEVLKYKNIARKIRNIDIVATHTAPDFAYPQTPAPIVMEYARYDYTLIHELKLERLLMTKIYNEVRTTNPELSHFIYGHFHQYRNEQHDGVDFICLEPNQLFDMKSIE